MCTLFSWHGDGAFPLVIAANRDEFTRRPWSGVRLWTAEVTGGARIWAPRDDEGGGTWLGINEHGLVAAVTNRLYRDYQPDRPSRGRLCIDVLAAPDLEQARQRVREAVQATVFNGFNIVIGQGTDLWWMSYGRGELRETALPPGAHVITSQHDLNPELLAPYRSRFEGLIAEARGDWGALATTVHGLLSDPHPVSPEYTICKVGSVYGTRSSTLWGVDRQGEPRMYFAPGRPDITPFEGVPLELT